MKVSVSGKLFTVGLISFWYASNIGVLLLNKYLLSNHGFRYPIFLTLCHMMACSILSYVAIAWLKMVPMQTVRSRVQFVKISSLGLIFCLSVVGQHLPPLPTGVVQPGRRRYHAVLHGGVRLFDDPPEGGLAHVCHTPPGCRWCYYC